ncbi:MAG TPA: hypothetical protein VGC77_07625, partial [Rhodopseudomonas sp.]|uniref:hypothetical protein n=1 Tax=Rhodopseudomonas sp. TaxID=1078 RepID=UPI002ED7CE44
GSMERRTKAQAEVRASKPSDDPVSRPPPRETAYRLAQQNLSYKDDGEAARLRMTAAGGCGCWTRGGGAMRALEDGAECGSDDGADAVQQVAIST